MTKSSAYSDSYVEVTELFYIEYNRQVRKRDYLFIEKYRYYVYTYFSTYLSKPYRLLCEYIMRMDIEDLKNFRKIANNASRSFARCYLHR